MNLDYDEEYWLALAYAPLSPAYLIRLVNYFGSPRHIFELTEQVTPYLSNRLLYYLKNPNWYAVEQDLAWLEHSNNHLLTLEHPKYPPLLRQIHIPPPLLFIQGECDLLLQKQLAIIGTRSATKEGKQIAYAFAKELSNCGFTITTGMAVGIENAAHKGALNATGKTITIAACGLNHLYSSKFKNLAQTTTLVSELSPNTGIKRTHFHSCSRIISGLSLGIIVIELPKYSHALDTVLFALEQGREVFVIPGSIHNPFVKGGHRLIKQGAKLVENVNDIFEELQIYLF
ncbi:MAG: DNA-processing protein DprA [Thiomargarita sp.]|nr:DNA-processing protein DprA [Thiomargarita sp.]